MRWRGSDGNEEYISEKYAEFREVNADEADFRIQWYICSFVEMASRGFYSFDRDVRTPFEDSKRLDMMFCFEIDDICVCGLDGVGAVAIEDVVTVIAEVRRLR